jgi:hypothetical protein
MSGGHGASSCRNDLKQREAAICSVAGHGENINKTLVMPRAIRINPLVRVVSSVIIRDYDGVRARFGPGGLLEGNTLCRFGNSRINLSCWVDARQYPRGPAWRSKLAPSLVMHGPTLVTAYDRVEEEWRDCPISTEEFATTIEWEDCRSRSNKDRPNQEWRKPVRVRAPRKGRFVHRRQRRLVFSPVRAGTIAPECCVCHARPGRPSVLPNEVKIICNSCWSQLPQSLMNVPEPEAALFCPICGTETTVVATDVVMYADYPKALDYMIGPYAAVCSRCITMLDTIHPSPQAALEYWRDYPEAIRRHPCRP